MSFWILILLVQDPTHQSHILRVGAYNSETNCKGAAQLLIKAFGKTTDYYCVPADLPN
jgi:hypothetical protein